MDIEKVIKNLSSNNMEAFFVKDKEEGLRSIGKI